MTVIRFRDGKVMIHSPCEFDQETKTQVEKLGQVAFIVAPGSYHYFYVTSCQKVFPDVQTFICPGIERKCPDLNFD